MIPPTPFADTILDEPTAGQLVFDIAHAAELVAVIQKGHGARRAAQPEHSQAALDAGYQALAAREIAGLQLRYRFAGEEWWDTLTWTAHGLRLIRISHTRAVTAPDVPAQEGGPR